MPKHKPIKFQTTLETGLKDELIKVIKENECAKTALNATLALIALGGILTFGAAMPNILGVFGKARQQRKIQKYEEYQKLWRNFNKLKKQGELEFIKEENGYLVYKPTRKGKEKIKKLILNELILAEPQKWDKKWRLVIFDIPEVRRKERNALRKKLQEMDFYQCQKSAWIHPFPCLEEIEFLKNYFNIKPFVKIFVISEMADGKVLYYFKDLIREKL